MATKSTATTTATASTTTTTAREIETAVNRKLSTASTGATGASAKAPSWHTCYYCTRENFNSIGEFVNHLRSRHCTREGGSFVCRYGFNGVCASLPLDGVSDRDYDAHVSKYHVNQQTREMPPEWCVYSAAQNLPAVLNDPSRGKQSNLFTKKWGEHFVERAPVPPTVHLPDITHADFATYLSSIGKRYRWHERRQQQQEQRSLVTATAETTTPTHLSAVPEIFLKAQLQLHHAPTFAQVFPGYMQHSSSKEANGTTSTTAQRQQTGRLLQEQLSHYLDIVEVMIARQVSQKSAAFFHAMTTQHAIMAEMQQAAEQVRQLRMALSQLHGNAVVDSFRVLRYAERRQHYSETLDKLRLMATVHKTQPMLQLLLGTQDYVAALDLIGTTQEILAAELIGVHCFKHLPMQLHEMEKLIDKMLSTEFERYAATDLNRPLASDGREMETDSVCAEEDKLVAIVMGLLRKQNFSFVHAYQQEAMATMRAIIKQLLIELLERSDMDLSLTGAGEQAQNLTLDEWIALLQAASKTLRAVLERIKAVVYIMQQTTDAAAGMGISRTVNADNAEHAVNLIDSEAFLSQAHHTQVRAQLQQLLQAVCHYCHERCANIVTPQSLEQSIANMDQLQQLTEIVQQFSKFTETICGVASVPLQLALKVQVSRYAQRFHAERKQKLGLLLDQERWRQVDVPQELQRMVERMQSGDYTEPKEDALLSNGHGLNGTNPVLLLESKQTYTLVSAALLLIQMLYMYGCQVQKLPLLASYHGRNVVDLLRTFNSRSCQLIIGAGAMRVAGLKTITSTNLALVSRALQLVLWLLPKLREHFQALDASSVSGYDAIEKDFHGHIKEIELKIHGIVSERVSQQLLAWEARPPIPSQTFRNISRHLVKLHEAIAGVLPEPQIHAIYAVVHRNFKDKLREQLLKHNINNNGGPQHGVVTSELTFYMETLRTLRALPAEQLNDDIHDQIWLH
ncbi:vacuolar protein sorting-associated protein 54 [Scaptodrosophila lebanonensis]|uniref:Vacuolar protein sorting-associated protein 54 n=1 Tax=Drosophila lebanonensis TaxID=7225 RepID=A0A6J2TNH4_DROLE|nr:vacuolar protein sorting-associated protein 54 [Scaptodrosophila lebanonensis]XP_030377070.1 vacuolar protein sorting-associated protein 54 [Scaptodrosophila lebanonensis]